MLIIEGSSLHHAGRKGRMIAIVTGTCWSPKVFEIARCEFEHKTDETAAVLALPVKGALATMPCRVSANFECVFHQTSSELVLDLVRAFAEMHVFVAEHMIIDVDGSLLWSEVTALKAKGVLWKDGMRRPLDEPIRASARRGSSMHVANQLMSGNPFSESARPTYVASVSGRRQGHGAATAGRKRRHDTVAGSEGTAIADEGGGGQIQTPPLEDGHAEREPEDAATHMEPEMDLADVLAQLGG